MAQFPDEILMEIFLNLPVRSLFVIRSVCKRWLGLIESPTFIRLQLNHPINDDCNSLLTILDAINGYGNNPNFEFVLTLMSGAYMEDVPLAALSPSMASGEHRKVDLLGPCNGLFGITNRSDIVIFNPVTRQCRQVPFSPSVKFQGRDDDGYYYQHLCFGFDSASNDYKIVGFNAINLVAFNTFNLGMPVDESSSYRLEMSVFRFSTNNWTQLDSCVGTPSYTASELRHTLFFKGACHWSYHANRKYSMAVFDLNKEALKQFELPTTPDINPHLSVLGEYMAIAGQPFFSNKEIEIWVMKEYGVYNSWTKLYNIDAEHVLNTGGIFSFGNNGEFLFWDHSRNLGSFNLNTRVVEELGFFERPRKALRFRGSLVSPGRS